MAQLKYFQYRKKSDSIWLETTKVAATHGEFSTNIENLDPNADYELIDAELKNRPTIDEFEDFCDSWNITFSINTLGKENA